MELWPLMDIWAQTELVFLFTLLVAFLPGAVEVIAHPNIYLPFDRPKS